MFKTYSTTTKRVEQLLNNYLTSPLIIDIEYMQHYTNQHQKNFDASILKRATCHSYSMENITPVIKPNELLVGSKTRFTRGSIPYCNYASSYVLRELSKEENIKNFEEDIQEKVTDIGKGGGMQINKEILKDKNSKFSHFGKKHLIPKKDLPVLKEIANYWNDKCMQFFGDKLWKNYFNEAEYIDKGWKDVLYTAAHDPAPEGRYVLDYETSLKLGFRQLINKMKKKIINCDV